MIGWKISLLLRLLLRLFLLPYITFTVPKRRERNASVVLTAALAGKRTIALVALFLKKINKDLKNLVNAQGSFL